MTFLSVPSEACGNAEGGQSTLLKKNEEKKTESVLILIIQKWQCNFRRKIKGEFSENFILSYSLLLY